MARIRRFILPVLVLGLVVAGVVISFRPRAVAADTATVTAGPLVVTVDEDGRTRVKDRYVVYSPLAGRLGRITLEAGDAIKAGVTTLAVIDPSDPELLDARAVAEAEARVSAARLAVERAQTQVTAANAAQEFATNEVARIRESARLGAATPREVEDYELDLTLRTQEARAAEFARQIARFELEQAEAALIRTRPDAPAADLARLTITAPIDGHVLRVLRKSEGFVAAGAELLEIGDAGDLEVEVDVLSADAVKIAPGAAVFIEDWGGEEALNGRVRVVEPSAFTKISALGVEEQRVWVIIDFTDPAERRAGLGDGYRVVTRIVIAEADNVLKVPTGALFRHGGGWAVYLVDGERARLRTIMVGRRNDQEAEVVGGLSEGDRVVVYPSDRVVDGAELMPRGDASNDPTTRPGAAPAIAGPTGAGAAEAPGPSAAERRPPTP